MDNSYNLFLDDVRDPKEVYWVSLPDVKWTIVKNYQQFIQTITQRGLPKYISFDHDLAGEHYLDYGNSQSSTIKKINYSKFINKTGYHCAAWLAQHCLDNQLPLPVYWVHSLNEVGRGNIHSIMQATNKTLQILENYYGKSQS